MSLLMIIIPVVVIALIVLIVVGMKTDTDRGGEEMIKNVYVYLVLFATLMMTIGGSVGVFMAAADIISPVTYYQTFEEYKRYPEKMPVETQPSETVSEEELHVRYNEMVAAEKERQIVRAKNSLIKALGWIIIPLPVFIYFQRRRLA